MSFDKNLVAYLKQQLGFESDVQFIFWSGISKNSMSGIQTGRLAMGESIRFVLLEKWWMHLRPRTTENAMPSLEAARTQTSSERPSDFSAQVLLEIVKQRLSGPSAALFAAVNLNEQADAALLDAYKIYKRCETDTELANLLGIKRNSISMVRSGRNKLGPLPLLRIYEDLCNAQHLGLPSAVQSSEALMQLFTQGKVQT